MFGRADDSFEWRGHRDRSLKMKQVVAAAVLAVAAASLAFAQPTQHGSTAEGPSLHSPGDIQWKDGPASLPAGAQFAVLEGDPAKEGFFCMRVRLPDGYRIPPHTHPKTERLTVISGTFHLGMGEIFDRSAGRRMTAGSFGYWPAGMKHFAWTQGETVVQLHGMGPWQIVYLNPADDPRNGRK
jgi:quercetin dioxygenase-like cupin family protein